MENLIHHYNAISKFISDWQANNVLPLMESNAKFKIDFVNFFETSNIPKEIKDEFLKDLI